MPETNRLITGMVERLVLDLYDTGMIKFGQFTLKSGRCSFIYADIRNAISYPVIFRTLCDMLYAKMVNLQYQSICGVPYSALTFASAIAYAHHIPMLLKRKEMKTYGTKKLLEGNFKPGERCLIIEDVISTGLSIEETAVVLQEAELVVEDVVVFLNRNLGGRETLTAKGYHLHSIIDLEQLVDILHRYGKISAADRDKCLEIPGAESARL